MSPVYHRPGPPLSNWIICWIIDLFTDTGNLFVFGGLPRGMTYRVTADYFDRHLPGFDDALLAFGS